MPAGVETERIIHIATGFDRNYLHAFHALVGSLIKNHSETQFALHIMTDGVAPDDLDKIRSRVVRAGHQLRVYEVNPSLTKNLVLAGEWTPVVYYRLFFSGSVRKDIRRLIYLDCDIVTIKSLWSLYTVELDGCPVGAVYDNYVKKQPQIGITAEGEYFNSGVLVIDLEKWRSQRISEKCISYLRNYPDRILYVDQCALNAVLRNNWKKLEARYNMMYSAIPENIDKRQLDQLLKTGVIVHFTLQRPWNMLCKNRLRRLYYFYLGISGIKVFPWSRYSDFEIRKIPAWLTIRLSEFYFDTPWVQRIWRSLPTK